MPKYTYLRNKDNTNNNQVITIATELHHDNNEVFYAVSYCSKKDKHNKKIAHAICIGRLAIAPNIVAIKELSHKVIIDKIKGCLIKRESTPNWAVKIMRSH